MKKILALILALAMCFALVACGGEKAEDKKEVETIKIGALYPFSGASSTAGNEAKFLMDIITKKVNEEAELETAYRQKAGKFEKAKPVKAKN